MTDRKDKALEYFEKTLGKDSEEYKMLEKAMTGGEEKDEDK